MSKAKVTRKGKATAKRKNTAKATPKPKAAPEAKATSNRKAAPEAKVTDEAKSKAPILERLLKHIRRISNDLMADYEDGLHSGTSEAVADYRETFVQEVIGRFFPRTYRVSKGPLFDSSGGRSNSIDCVVCAPNHPLFLDALGRNTTLLVDGVHCAIEVKPQLTDLPEDFGASRQHLPELIRGLEQVRTCKRLLRTKHCLTLRKPAPLLSDYAKRVPTHLFSMEGAAVTKICEYLAAYYMEREVPLREQVDAILVLNSGLVQVNKYPPLDSRQRVEAHTGWTPLVVAFELGQDALAGFLHRIVNDIGPEKKMSEPVLHRYLKTHEWPNAVAAFRTYNG